MRTARRLLVFLDEVKGLVALSLGLGWATAVSWIALVSTSAWLISYAALRPSIAELQVAIVGVRFFGISRGVFRYLERLVSHTVTFRVLARFRVWLYEKIEPMAPAGVLDDTSGDLLSTLVDDVETLQEFYIRVAAPPLIALFSSVLFLAFIGRWSVWFLLTLLLFQVLTGILIPLAAHQFGKGSGEEVIRSRSEYSLIAVEVVQGNADILLSGMRPNYLGKVDKQIAIELEAENRQNRILGGHTGLTALLVNGSAVSLLVLAIPMVSAGYLDGRLLAVIVLGSLASFETILPLGEAFQRLQESLTSADRLFQLADRDVPPRGIELVRPDAVEVRFENVNFAYRQKDEFELKDFSLDLQTGKKVAIVGASGAGKSTLVNLLLNFWLPSEGELLINGKLIQGYDSDSVRAQFAYLPQNPFLFNTSIFENIRIGNSLAGREEVWSAAQKAGLAEFIHELPDEYETIVGEHGVLLSGGQRQRLALARAFVRESPFLILDEPTSNLDRQTGRAIVETVFSTLGGRGLVLISHHFERLEDMNEILLLESGHVLERGTQDELLRMEGRFARMYADQQDFFSE
jgi:ATP-binding cassette subfamily C protein CydC